MPTDFDTRLDVDIDGGLPDSVDEAALRRMETVAYLLDESVRVPVVGVRVGVDPILGILPVAGDVASGVLSMYIVAESAYLGVSPKTLVAMLANITIDVGGGSIPYAGTVFDAFWKANKRNVALALEELAVVEEPEPPGARPDAVTIPIDSKD